MKFIQEDETHQGTKRILGVRYPQLPYEAANKQYVDDQVAEGGGGGTSGNIDGGHPDTDYSGGPVIDCGGVT